MARYELTEFERKVVQPLLPNKPRGVPRVDDRRVLNDIFWPPAIMRRWRRVCRPFSRTNVPTDEICVDWASRLITS